mgnify:FL=1
MRFGTKVDWWIVLVLAFAPVSMATAAIVTRDVWVLVGGFLFLGALSLIIVPCEYVLENKWLVVRSGLIRYRVPYDQIDEVRPTNNPLSSPAWSLDRLWISYGRKNIMISPKEKRKFLDAVALRANLKKEGDKLVKGTK